MGQNVATGRSSLNAQQLPNIAGMCILVLLLIIREIITAAVELAVSQRTRDDVSGSTFMLLSESLFLGDVLSSPSE